MNDTVKLIIEIPKDYYEALSKTKEIISSQRSGKTFMSVIYSAVANGTPLDSNSERAEVQAYFAGEAYGWEEGRKDLIDELEAEIVDTLYVDSLIFGELIDFKNGKISADDVIEEFNRVTRSEVLKIIDKYKAEVESQESEVSDADSD